MIKRDAFLGLVEFTVGTLQFQTSFVYPLSCQSTRWTELAGSCCVFCRCLPHSLYIFCLL